MSNYKLFLQSNNEALNANNLDLQSLIDQANALPDAGGKVDTCTLIINNALLDDNVDFYYTSYENNSFVYNYIKAPLNQCTNNVVCGSIILIHTGSINDVPYAGSGVVKIGMDAVKAFRITAAKGETAIINMQINDF